MFKLLTSYLSERHICVKINEKISSSCLLYYEVSRGLILESLLFYVI